MLPSSAFDTYTNVPASAATARVMSAINMMPPVRIAKVFIFPLLSWTRPRNLAETHVFSAG